jgi:hypothetical protein
MSSGAEVSKSERAMSPSLRGLSALNDLETRDNEECDAELMKENSNEH